MAPSDSCIIESSVVSGSGEFLFLDKVLTLKKFFYRHNTKVNRDNM